MRANTKTKSKNTKTKFNWTKELIFLIIGLVAMIIVTIVLALPSDTKKIYDKYTEAGASLDSDHVYSTINYKKLKKNIASQGENDVLYVFYGSTSCSNCVSAIQTINTAAKSFEIDKVYYFDATFIDSVEDKENAEFLANVDKKEVELGGVDLLSYPAIWVYKGGKLAFTTDSYKATDSSTTIEGTWKLAAYHVFGTKW